MHAASIAEVAVRRSQANYVPPPRTYAARARYSNAHAASEEIENCQNESRRRPERTRNYIVSFLVPAMYVTRGY